MHAHVALWIVADGVGGRKDGDVASSLATHSMSNFFEASREGAWPDEYRVLLDLTLPPPAQRLCAAIRKANHDVHEVASTRKGSAKMSTTVVALHLEPEERKAYIAHVGDSRCYRFRAGRLEKLTRDHSLRNEARISTPSLSERELERIPERVITRALGVKPTVEIDVSIQAVAPGDVFVLCSDGVNRMINDASILEALTLADDPPEAADMLVELSNEAGGRDNSTALVVQVAS